MQSPALPVSTLLLAIVLAVAYLICSGHIYIWDGLYMAFFMRAFDTLALFSPYHPLAAVPYYLWWNLAVGMGSTADPLACSGALNAILSALAVAAFFELARRLTRHRSAALGAALGLAFSLGFWFEAEAVKTYPFSTLLAVGTLLAWVLWRENPRSLTRLRWLSLLLAALLLSHLSFVSFALPLAFGLYRIGGRSALQFVAIRLLSLLAGGYAAVFSLVVASHPDVGALGLISYWRREFGSRHFLAYNWADVWTRLPLMLSGHGDPTGEVLPYRLLDVPGQVTVAAGVALLLACLGWWARRERHGQVPLLWAFLVLHLLLTGFIDSHNENLHAVLLPLWLMAARMADRGGRLAGTLLLLLALALGSVNFTWCIGPNRLPGTNPYYERAVHINAAVQPNDIVIGRVSLAAQYLLYFAESRVIILDPGDPSTLEEARRALWSVPRPGRRVLVDPLVCNFEDGWCPDPEPVIDVFLGTRWSNYIRLPEHAFLLQKL